MTGESIIEKEWLIQARESRISFGSEYFIFIPFCKNVSILAERDRYRRYEGCFNVVCSKTITEVRFVSPIYPSADGSFGGNVDALYIWIPNRWLDIVMPFSYHVDKDGGNTLRRQVWINSTWGCILLEYFMDIIHGFVGDGIRFFKDKIECNEMDFPEIVEDFQIGNIIVQDYKYRDVQ